MLHDDGLPAGAFGNWSTGDTFKWNAKNSSQLSAEDEESASVLKAERQKREAEAFAKAAEISHNVDGRTPRRRVTITHI